MKNVYQNAISRLQILIQEFDQIYISFSGGKDSGVLLNLYMQCMAQYAPDKRPVIFHMDYEVCYQKTDEYISRTLQQYRDSADIYHICVPFKVNTCTSMFQSYWRPWDEDKQDLWVRQLPEKCYTKKDFDFYDEEMWDYEFQFHFARWLHQKNRAKRTCCLVGIRTQESHNRWRAIYNNNRNAMYRSYKWTSHIQNDIYNAYPIHDWKTTDVWTANGKFGWDYNRLYDLYFQAGISIERQRVASPFLCEARESLRLYKIIDPDMWGRMIGRVNGVNFTGLYGGTHAMARRKINLPSGFTWEKYMHFLLATLPEETRKNYLKKLKVSIDFWRNKGGALSDCTIKILKQKKIPIILMDSPYKTSKKAVRMEYLDEIDIPAQHLIPSFKRVCICILRNDYHCRYMGFGLNTEEKSNRDRVMREYKNLKQYLNE